MNIILSHVWAIWWWRTARLPQAVDTLRTGICRLEPAPNTHDELKESGVYDMRTRQVQHGIPADLPIELLSGANVTHTSLFLAKIHQWAGPAPIGAICASAGLLVCAPEFCFVLIASDITHICKEPLRRWQHVVILSELGCELCGTYVRRNTPRGFENTRQQLINSWQLFSFVGVMANERGGATAHDALRWVIDGLNSPMETVLYLMLCLPPCWGGLGLCRPRANWSLEVPSELRGSGGQEYIKPDLLWLEYSLIAEYFGEESHTGHEVADIKRDDLAKNMGYEVVTFWKEDILDLGRFNAKGRKLAQRMGRALPKADKKFMTQQQALQRMLMRHQRWI